MRARYLAPILCALASVAAAPAASAQITLRIEPTLVVLPGGAARTTIAIYADNVPAPGINSFDIKLNSHTLPSFTACARFIDLAIDPNLEEAWGGGASSTVYVTETSTVVEWVAIGFPGRPGPTGTVKLGTMRWFGLSFGQCFLGKQDRFEWDPDVTRFGFDTNPTSRFDVLQGAQSVLVRILDADLAVFCTQVSPTTQGILVDGDTITLDCTATNLGTDDSQIPLGIVAVLSSDTVVDSGDFLIDQDQIPAIPGGGSRDVTLSANPVLPVPQSLNLCVKIDVNSTMLDAQDGEITEVDESNNVECRPVTIVPPRRDLIVAPGSVRVEADPLDPNGQIRAGLGIRVTYDELNEGTAAVRLDHRNLIRLGLDPAIPPIDPASVLCGVTTTAGSGLPLAGGATLTQSFGLGSGSSPEVCQVPFTWPDGSAYLFIQLDAGGNIVEADPNGDTGPAEANNTVAVPIDVGPPLDPQFRVQDRADPPTDQTVEIFGPAKGEMRIAVASARGLASYGLTLHWDPPELMSIGDPPIPGGDPSEVSFTTFLEQGGRVQDCAVQTIDNSQGRLELLCTTVDPGGGLPAVTERSEPLAVVSFTPLLPGSGALTISGMSATDGAGLPFGALRSSDGTFSITGQPDLKVIDPLPPGAVFPGVAFESEFDLRNDGFGAATPPVITELLVSRDAFNDPIDPNSPDVEACASAETMPLPGKTTVSRMLSGCMILDNLRPGFYTGFYELKNEPDPNRRSTATLALSTRIVALRKKGGGGRKVEISSPPQTLAGKAVLLPTGSRGFDGGSIASLRSTDRNLDWLVRMRNPKSGPNWLEVLDIPTEHRQKAEVLGRVRAPRQDKMVLAGADVDGDGEDELVVLRRTRGSGDSLSFRKVDYTRLWPDVCPPVAETPGFTARVLAAAGIQYDADPEDEIAVVTDDGELTIYDVTLIDPVPAILPCELTTRPVYAVPPTTAILTPVASDTEFSTRGNVVRSICGLDVDFDGFDEIGSLGTTGSGSQTLRIFEPPAAPGGSALLIADDPAFTGKQGGRMALAITCTR